MSSERDGVTAELKVGAHVLVQLGSELVTDAEQAILECVKNAYDADSPSCRIEIDTHEEAVQEERGLADRIAKFNVSSETVQVELCNLAGTRFDPRQTRNEGSQIVRKLKYSGRITIEDKGDGLRPDQLRSSWLVISRSAKRQQPGERKQKTKKGRTPLGDKGLGRLGSMKLGDILRIETATSVLEPISVAQFRWTDCESAQTVDEIPVFMTQMENTSKFKGTRVSVLGLHEIPEWRRKDRILEITHSLAKLISPFESKSSFPVGISLDGVNHSLVSVTDEVLARAIADFHFKWQLDPTDSKKRILVAVARFRKRLFTSERSESSRDRTRTVFGSDDGDGFLNSLKSFGRLKGYKQKLDVNGAWLVELTRTYQWTDMQLSSGAVISDPGTFDGAFYFFHLDRSELDDPSAAGLGVDKNLIKGMSGISVLRDGFRVRSPGDWLGLSSGMTSGSTYGMRVDNTIGYFALTGEANYKLTEKSDREGFVEDANYRGFMQIALQCKSFANEALEQVRRALDDYYKKLRILDNPSAAQTVGGSFGALKSGVVSADAARLVAERDARNLRTELAHYQSDTSLRPDSRALKFMNQAVLTIDKIQSQLSKGENAQANLLKLQAEFNDKEEQILALFESAAVGLSARGFTHEVRTHITEIRKRTVAIEKLQSNNSTAVVPHLRAIRTSCSAIAKAASLIDPMLPRARAIKESIDLSKFVEEYFASRSVSLRKAQIAVSVTGTGILVRANRPRLTQVLDNLVRNSVYWLRRGVAIGTVDRPMSILLELVPSGFVISDSGPGVDPAYEDSLFEIFVTGKSDRESGQGLGLFIIRELLRIDGCEVDLLSERNSAGRRYRFAVNLLPLAE